MKKKIILVYLFIIFLVSGCSEKATTVKETQLDVVEVNITADKVMVPSEINIKKGTIVRFLNSIEKYSPNIIIYPANEKPVKEKVIAKSENINPGESWEYTFEISGEFIAKDIYSNINGKIIVE